MSYLVGRLRVYSGKARESASFEYDSMWLANPLRFALKPALSLHVGSFHTPPEKALFGAIGDSASDRWGRMLMRRAKRREHVRLGQTQRTLMEIDYVLQVDDETRQGALRFKHEESGPFLAEPASVRIPPLAELPRLLAAADHVSSDMEDDEDLRLLLAPGSSLGGARPKASIRDYRTRKTN